MSRSPFPAIERRRDAATLPTRAMLAALLVGASLAFSMAFACATPFAALAAVAALRMPWRSAVLAVTLAWLVNQADGFLFMHYPHTWSCIGWGLAIWLASVAATLGANAVTRRLAAMPLASHGAAFAVAFAAYESVLLCGVLLSGSSTGAFWLPIIGRVLEINVLAFVLLLASIGLLDVLASTAKPSRLAAVPAPGKATSSE